MFSMAMGSPIAVRSRCSMCTRPPAGTPSRAATTGSGSTVDADRTSVPGVRAAAVMLRVKLPTLKRRRGSATKVPRRGLR